MNKPDKINENELRIQKNERIVIIAVSVFLACAVFFGIVVGAIVGIRRARAAMMFEGVFINEGVASYLAVTYKSVYMQQIGEAYDTKEFWETSAVGSSKTYGELLVLESERYVKSVAVGAYLFDRYTKLTKAEKQAIERATGEILEYVADGSVDKFNENTGAMGFDYDDFCRATELMYKSETAKAVIYGYDGSALMDGANLAACDEYFAEFARVKILFIPTDTDIAREEDGSLITDSEGMYVTEYFTPAEKAERWADINRIRELIDGIDSGADEQMSPEYFDKMQKKYNYSEAYNASGYYLSPYSEFTSRFAEESSAKLPDGYRESLYKYMSSAVEVAFTLSDGQYHIIEGDWGVCVIHKVAKEEYAYLSTAYDIFFHDFYSDAADYLYASSLDTLIKSVTVKDKYGNIDVISRPYNCDYIATVEY